MSDIRDEMTAFAGIPVSVGIDLAKPGSDRTAIAILMKQAEGFKRIKAVEYSLKSCLDSFFERFYRSKWGKRKVMHWRGKRFCVKTLSPKLKIVMCPRR